MSKQWFILSTFTGKEVQVANTLNSWKDDPNNEYHDFIGEVLVPETKEKDRVVFPGYAFAEIDAFEDFIKGTKRTKVWNAVCEINGMIGFLGGDNPRPMSEDEIASVRKYMDEKEIAKEKIELKVGDVVKVLDGAFAGNEGTVKEIKGDVVVVEVELFGEETEQEIALGSLEKVEE